MREKGAVYRALKEDGVAVINADDGFAMRAADFTKGRRVTFGKSDRATYRLRRRDPLGAKGSLLRISTKDRDLTVEIPLPGEAAAIDLVAAIAAVEAASGEELDAGQIETALARVKLDGRATIRALPSGIVVLDDTYNANPQSMRAAFATLREIAGARRKIAVLGEMKELGPLAGEEHTALGDAIADAGIDLAIGCGGLVDLALERAKRRRVEVVAAKTTLDAAREVTSRLRENDAVLVKASRSVGAEKVVEALAKAAESLPSS
jgi:UDP-N-acetylmuramoyl-tripeptide--D-alanyl-D-alanine ligase